MHLLPKVSFFCGSPVEQPDRKSTCICRWGGKVSDDILIFMASFTEESTTGAILLKITLETILYADIQYLATAIDT